MTTIIIKENIKYIDELPKIKLTIDCQNNQDDNILIFENILNNINDMNKKMLIIELLNYTNIKDYIKLCNNNLYFSDIKFINMENTDTCYMDHAKWYIHINPTCKIKFHDSIKLLNNQYCRADHPYNIYYTQYILYNKNINILHLILFHDVNINKVLIFLLY